MKAVFIEDGDGTRKVYDSLLVEPGNLSIFNSDLAMQIISELAKNPACAMDLARKIGQHEQKVYYHLKKMRDAGVVVLDRNEARYGMTAKIYSLSSPVISAKLFDGGRTVESAAISQDPDIVKFLSPFIKDGALNSLIIVGDPYPHGKFDSGGLDGCYIADLTMFLGNFVKSLSLPCSSLDVRMHEHDLKNKNIILIGNSRWNTIISRINNTLPIYFDENNSWAIVSKKTGKKYEDDLAGVILKCSNPFNKNKKMILLGGRRTRGTQAAIVAFTQHIKEIMMAEEEDGTIARVVHGIDSSGNGIIDDVKFLE